MKGLITHSAYDLIQYLHVERVREIVLIHDEMRFEPAAVCEGPSRTSTPTALTVIPTRRVA